MGKSLVSESNRFTVPNASVDGLVDLPPSGQQSRVGWPRPIGCLLPVGSRVRSVRVGEAVFGVHVPYRASGAWAELCIADERWLAAKPKDLLFGTAAACEISGLVAVSAVQTLGVRPGLRIVIVGATGGIGGMAVQLAFRAAAEVIGICSSAHADRARQMGCSMVLDHRDEPWDSDHEKGTSAD